MYFKIRKKLQIVATVLFSVVGLSVSLAQENGEDLRAPWMALADQSGRRDLEITTRGGVTIAHIVPRTLYRLNGAAEGVDGKKLAPEGLLLLAVEGQLQTRCEATLRNHWDHFLCLVDADGDGKYDHYLLSSSQSTLFQKGKVGSQIALVSPVGMTDYDPRNMKNPVEISMGYAGPLDTFRKSPINRFHVCFDVWRPALLASGRYVTSCLPEFRIEDSRFPVTFKIMGRMVTFVSRDDKTVRLSILYPEGEAIF